MRRRPGLASDASHDLALGLESGAIEFVQEALGVGRVVLDDEDAEGGGGVRAQSGLAWEPGGVSFRCTTQPFAASGHSCVLRLVPAPGSNIPLFEAAWWLP